ncbi:MAG: hypothetical protein QOG43_3250 [Actinomycetota bacterium]|jgi:Ca2+-binding EF-hand superfamily protein|nr:hypothetical protein [Actinomycetota bacterium]
MPSDVIDRKVTYLLELCDQNGDGLLEVSDFEMWIERMAAIRGWERGSADYAGLEALFLDAYKGMQAAYANPDGRIEIAAMKDTLVAMAAAGAPELGEWGDGFFRLIDADGDGVIARQEYRDLMASVFIDAAVADDAFARLDTNGDGVISADEFTQLYRDFFTSDDPDAPGSRFWGSFE